jgi:hypothetical protein
VPSVEQPNWTATWFGAQLNDFRTNPVGFSDDRAPDLGISSADLGIDLSTCPSSIRLTVTVWNRDAVLVTAGVPIAVSEGQQGGKLYAVAQTTAAILPGASEIVVMDLGPVSNHFVPDGGFQKVVNLWGSADLTVVVNDDGTGQSVVGECDRSNNAITLPSVSCPSAAG